MDNKYYYFLKLLRPRQWIKNFALFAAIAFGGQLFDGAVFNRVVIGFVAFCFLSSSTYILNDILDVEKDKLHPFKKNRPITSGKISIPEALIALFIFITIALFLARSQGGMFFLIAVSYFLLQIFYSSFLKSIVLFDIFIIATGYILRVLAGETISGYHISVWLLLTIVSLSLFLAVGKRRSELTLLKNFSSTRIEEVRRSLSHYSETLLDSFSTMFATSTFVFYSMFTFLENPGGIKISINLLLPEFLPSYLQRKWLMITIVPVIYGLMKYLQDIHEKKEGESPDRMLLNDKSLLASVLLWAFLVVVITYFIS